MATAARSSRRKRNVSGSRLEQIAAAGRKAKRFDGVDMKQELELTRQCLTLISRIAARAAASPDSEHVQDTVMELEYAMSKSPYGANQTGHHLRDLEQLHQELAFIDSTSQEFTARDVLKYAIRNTWN